MPLCASGSSYVKWGEMLKCQSHRLADPSCRLWTLDMDFSTWLVFCQPRLPVHLILIYRLVLPHTLFPLHLSPREHLGPLLLLEQSSIHSNTIFLKLLCTPRKAINTPSKEGSGLDLSSTSASMCKLFSNYLK